ncbi:hypothetical protein H2198_009057 [Neophaeococcomyces mojaviensis]|uniref:Uncharacterized protein n=1 Tax=Neophaeococcomyces mojaviensis TaxID=3383035 RepID=A0ACC2ZVH4_9EURO|nr:hypothetical protein H2198_009057 [Knufia sp. JES_112]
MTEPHIAFLGLGAMGFAMSTHLVRSGFRVTGFDIWQPTLDRWQQTCTEISKQSGSGAEPKFQATTSCSEAVKSGANIVILMVATHYQANSALFESGAVNDLPKDIPVVIMATVPPMYPLEVRKRLTEEYNRPDIIVVDAPVSGGVARSQNGTLTVMASSDDPANLEHSLVKTCISALSSNGKTLFPIPGTLGAGTSAKALNQVQCGIHIVGASEIMTLAALAGLNTKTFFDTVQQPQSSSTDGLSKEKFRYGWTWMLTNRAPRMIDPSLPIASAISIINKDVGIIVDEETRLKVELPLLNTANAQLKQCMDSGIAGWDDAYITKFYLDPTLKDETRMNTVISQASSSTSTVQDVEQVTETVLQAHALINLVSAYETVQFAGALDLMGEKQRDMWFRLIAGAAGGSTVFEEVVPVAFGEATWTDGFKKWTSSKLGSAWDLSKVEKLVEEVKRKNPEFKPVLVEGAIKFAKELSQ